MKVNLQKALTFYLTGTTDVKKVLPSETDLSIYSELELNDFETTRENFEAVRRESHKFKEKSLNLEADLNTTHGQFRMAGIGMVNSFFSGVGAKLGNIVGFKGGIGLAAGTLLLSSMKNVKALTKKFELLSIGGGLIRGPLHVLDSMFSVVGEQGSKYNLPSILAGGVSLLTLGRRVVGAKDSSFRFSFDDIGGTLGRTAVHHVDSMLASKASKLSTSNQNASAFIATSIATAGTMLPSEMKTKEIGWETFESFVAQGGGHFVDSLFSNIGNAFTGAINTPFKAIIGLGGLAGGLPLIGNFLNSWNKKVQYGTVEGNILRSVFKAPESLVFNLGSLVGRSKFGVPLSLGVAGITGLIVSDKKARKSLSKLEIERSSASGLYQRLPFDFLYSLMSSSGASISKLIPAPLIALVGPAISFQLGEKVKGISSKYDDVQGLLTRHSVHLWESIMSSAAYRTGKMITGIGSGEEELSAGSVLSDGRWVDSEGRIIAGMALGKQSIECGEKNLLGMVTSGISGVAVTAFAANVLKKYIGGKGNISVEKILSSELMDISENSELNSAQSVIEPTKVEGETFSRKNQESLALSL